jgi:hypothetical protein
MRRFKNNASRGYQFNIGNVFIRCGKAWEKIKRVKRFPFRVMFNLPDQEVLVKYIRFGIAYNGTVIVLTLFKYQIAFTTKMLLQKQGNYDNIMRQVS